MDERPRSARALPDARGQHLNDLVEGLPRQLAVRVRATHECVKVVLTPVATGTLRDDLLREHVERRDRLLRAVEVPFAHGADERCALDQLVARGREEPAARPYTERVARASDALHEGGDAPRRADLADEIDRADVDPQLQRGGRDEGAQPTVLQPLLQRQPPLLRQRAVMTRDVLLPKAQRQLVRDALRQATRVHEDQRRPMFGDQLRQPVVDLAPLLARRDRLQRARRHLHAELQITLVPEVDDRAARRAVARAVRRALAAHEERGEFLDRPLRRGESDARRA